MKRKPKTTKRPDNKPKPGTPPPRSKYQFHPPHPAPVHQAMDTSITNHGVQQPTVWDEEGNLLDGWERETICAEKGITCPRFVGHFDTEADKFRFILTVNAHRRPSLSQKEKREVIEKYLRGDPEIADNMLGETLGVSKNTVRAVRRRLEASGQIPKMKMTKGKDGKLRPVRYTPRIITNTPREFEKAQEIIRDLPPSCAGKTLDITTAKRRVARNRNKEEIESRRIIVPLPGDVLREPKEKDVDPWQQSLSEAERLLSYFSQPGDLVIDPCGGGFTTAVACLRLGRRCVSCDVDAGCVSRGLERLERARNGMTLGA